jgi:hypothetical protein
MISQMKHFTTINPLISFLLIPVLISLACNTFSGAPTSSSNPEQITMESDITFGPGDLDFPDPQAGLAELSSYQATLTLAFEGTRNGQPEAWSKIYTMQAMNNPHARQWTIDTGEGRSVFLAELDGMSYKKNGEDACLATSIQKEDPLTDRLELASFLSGVIGAEGGGSETINDMAANHYTFNQLALGEQDLTDSSGELWIASEGGYIVRFVLTKKADSKYFGEGMEGTLSWDYQLSDVNTPLTITLPDDCPPGLVDAPMLPDASNVLNIGGMLTYDTASSVEDAVAFYQEQIPASSWVLQGEPIITDVNALLTYTKGNKTMTIIIATVETHTEVRILVSET